MKENLIYPEVLDINLNEVNFLIIDSMFFIFMENFFQLYVNFHQ